MSEYTSARLECLLASAIDRSVPDLCAQAAQAPVAPITAPDGIVTAPPRHRWRYLATSLAACLLLVVGLGGFTFLGTHSVIGIDVNPSMELTINYFDKVLSIQPLNPEAAEIIGDMDLKFVDLDIAVNALVGSMALQGYFTAGEDVAVLVSVTGGTATHNRALQKKLALNIETAASTIGARAEVYTQNTNGSAPPHPTLTESARPTEPASPPSATMPAPAPSVPAPTLSAAPLASPSIKPDISHGKQVFISKLLTLDPTLDENELAAMPIGSIASLVRKRGLDISSIVDYDPDDSAKENIEDFIADLDDPDDDPDDDRTDSDTKPNNGNHKGWEKKGDDDDDDD